MGSPLQSFGSMRLFALRLLGLLAAVASVSGKDLRLNLLAPPTDVEYGFCDGSAQPFTFEVMSVEPFPILVQNGAMLSIAIQVSLNEEIPVGTQVALNMVLGGIIPIKIPCLDIDGLSIGSWGRLPVPHLCARWPGL